MVHICKLYMVVDCYYYYFLYYCDYDYNYYFLYELMVIIFSEMLVVEVVEVVDVNIVHKKYLNCSDYYYKVGRIDALLLIEVVVLHKKK